jgi:hypothetical protein
VVSLVVVEVMVVLVVLLTLCGGPRGLKWVLRAWSEGIGK